MDEGKERINLHSELVYMDGKTGFRRYSKKTKFGRGYKGPEIMENNDRLRPEGL